MKYITKQRIVEIFEMTEEEHTSILRNNKPLHCEWITENLRNGNIFVEDNKVYVKNSPYTWLVGCGDFIIKDGDKLFVEYKEFFNTKYEVVK